MKKENENIHLHIINEDYKDKKKKQTQHFESSGKAIELSELKNHAAVIEQLRKMHRDLAGTNEPELLDAEDQNQTEEQSSNESMSSFDVSELFTSYQRLKAEEQGLIDCRQDSLAIERSLQDRLSKEIRKKKKAIEELQTEISAIQNTCREIEKELGSN